jgi:hypothetical protein
MKEITTKTEQKKKKITIKEDNQKQSESKNKENTEEELNNTVNKLLKKNRAKH